MAEKEIHVVTGAFGFSGKYIAKRLIDAGFEVRTLTNSQRRENPFGGQVKTYSFNFNDPDKLAESLRGAKVLYNTYWVRFNHGGLFFFSGSRKHEEAVRGSREGRYSADRTHQHPQCLGEFRFRIL